MPHQIILKALSIEPAGDNSYATRVGNDQRYGEFLHGGFAASLLCHTALEHARDALGKTAVQRVISCQAQYLKPVDKSEIRLHVETSKVGKTNASLHVVLSQKGKPAVTGDISVVDESANRGITHALDTTLKPLPPPADFTAMSSGTDPNWTCYHLPYSKTSQGQPLAHWNLYFTKSGPVTPQIHDMWCSPHHSEDRITTVMLPLLADSYLRHAANFEADSDFSYSACVARAERSVGGDVRQKDLDNTVATTWSATQSLSLEIVRQLPSEGVKWVLVRAVARTIQDGRLIAEITMLDEGMMLLAYGKVVDQLIPAGRWVKEGRREGTGARMMKM